MHVKEEFNEVIVWLQSIRCLINEVLAITFSSNNIKRFTPFEWDNVLDTTLTKSGM